MGQFIKNVWIWLFQNVEKSNNKVEVAEEFGCANKHKSLQKIGGKNEMFFCLK